MIVDVLRREGGGYWRYVCLVDGCGYWTIPLTDSRAAQIRRVHRHRHQFRLAPIPWRPAPHLERY